MLELNDLYTIKALQQIAIKINICYILNRTLMHALLKLEKGKLLEKVGRKAVSLTLSGDK